MPSIPLWIIGRTVTAVVVTPLIPDVDGLLGAAALAAQSFTAIADEISYSGTVQTAEISPLTASRQNLVPLEEDGVMVITEILRNSALLNLGARIWMQTDNPDRALFQFSRGGNKLEMYGTLDSYDETVTKGKSIAHLSIRMIDTGVTNNPIIGAAFVG